MPSPSDGAPFEIGIETDGLDRSCDGGPAVGAFLGKRQGTAAPVEYDADGAASDGSRDRFSRTGADIETACGPDFDLRRSWHLARHQP